MRPRAEAVRAGRVAGLAALLALAAAAGQAPAQDLTDAAAREKARREQARRERGTPAPVPSYGDSSLPGAWKGWQPYTCAACGFSALFPAAPSVSREEILTGAGPALREVYAAELDDRKYVVTATPYPAKYAAQVGVERLFDEAEKQACADLRARPLTRFPAVQGGRLVHNFTLASTFTGPDPFLKLEGRMLFDGGRLYVVLQFLRNGADSLDLPTDLVDSFELVAAPRPAGQR